MAIVKFEVIRGQFLDFIPKLEINDGGLVLAASVHACFHEIFYFWLKVVFLFYCGQLVGASGCLLSSKPALPVVHIAAHSLLAAARHQDPMTVVDHPVASIHPSH